VEERARRVAENEVLFRQMNEHVVAGGRRPAESYEIICECADRGCMDHVRATTESYERAILLIGYIDARIVGGLVTRVLQRAGLDRMLERGAGGSYVTRLVRSPSALLGSVTFWVVFLGALSIAVDVLGIAALEDLVRSVWSYIPNVLAALLIFVVASAIAGGVVALVERTMGETPTGRIVKTVAPVLVMAIALFMILDQLEIAPTIVTITYAALIGAIALAMAIAFGLGGRDVAARLLESAYVKGQDVKDDVKRDLQTGVRRGKADVEQATQRPDDPRPGVS
jgi:hypothetical protein